MGNDRVEGTRGKIKVMKKTYHLCLSAGDEILFRDGEKSVPDDTADTEMLFSRKAVTDSLLSRLIPKKKPEANKHMVPVTDLEKRLSLLAH